MELNSLQFDVGTRAANMLYEVDSRYFRFANQLEEPIKSLALKESTYIGQESEEAFDGISSLNPLIGRTGWLFWDVFKMLEDEEFVDIAEAGLYLALASGVMDHLVDGQYNHPAPYNLYHHAIYQQGVNCFRDIFPDSSDFWIQFYRLEQEYITCLGIEIDSQCNPRKTDFETFARSSGGKVSPMVISIAALAIASSNPGLIPKIEKSFRCSYVAGQIHDDILDWQLDLEFDHNTYYLQELGRTVNSKGNSQLSEIDLLSGQAATWIDVDYYRKCLDWFDKASESVSDVECDGWKEYLSEYRLIAEQHQKVTLLRHIAGAVSAESELYGVS